MPPVSLRAEERASPAPSPDLPAESPVVSGAPLPSQLEVLTELIATRALLARLGADLKTVARRAPS